MSEPLTDEMLAKLRTFELKPDDQVWMATIDRLQAALTAAQTERDEWRFVCQVDSKAQAENLGNVRKSP